MMYVYDFDHEELNIVYLGKGQDDLLKQNVARFEMSIFNKNIQHATKYVWQVDPLKDLVVVNLDSQVDPFLREQKYYNNDKFYQNFFREIFYQYKHVLRNLAKIDITLYYDNEIKNGKIKNQIVIFYQDDIVQISLGEDANKLIVIFFTLKRHSILKNFINHQILSSK